MRMAVPFAAQLTFLLLLLPFAQSHYRLPVALEPQHYDLHILTHLNETDLRFEGLVNINLLVLHPSKNITLHAKNLTIDESRIEVNSSNESISIKSIELDDKYEFYIIHLSKKLKVGKHYELKMLFEGQLNTSNTGYYKSSYNDTQTNQTHYMAVTQFSPTFARLAFPCFDEPNWKATFNVTLGYHRNYTGLSNTPIMKCEAHESLDNYVWCKHEPLLRTSTYLVAYAVHNLTQMTPLTSNTQNNVIFQSWIQPKLINQSQFSHEMAPKMLAHLEQLFQFSFPLSKIDQLASPTHKFSAMENWGLVTFQEHRFAHDDVNDLLEQKQKKANTMAHEYTHQWFGNLVTMKWWQDLWLKEGPSTYFAYSTLDALLPEWGWGEQKVAKDLALFFLQDSSSSTRAISREVKEPHEILGQFSEYVYEKGALTMRMLNKILGDESFYKGVRQYLKTHAYGNVEQNDLWESMNFNSNFSLSTAMNSWTLQEGYPLIEVRRDYINGNATLIQNRFYLGNVSEVDTKECWWVPLSWVRQNQPDFNQTQPEAWLECPLKEKTLSVNAKTHEWLILNPQIYAIYRVNYDLQNWQMIIKALQTEPNYGGIHPLNRAQLLDDLISLAALGKQSYDLVFDLAEYLKQEQEFVPIERGLSVLQLYGGLLKGTEAAEFKVYMAKLLTTFYARLPKLEFIKNTSTTLNQRPFQILIYTHACLYSVANCVPQALKLSKASYTSVPSDFRALVFCTAIREGAEKEFEEMLQFFKNSTILPLQRSWASGLGCTRNFTRLKQFLDYTLKSEKKTINDCYIQAVKSALFSDEVGQETGNHILDHAQELNDKFKERDLNDILLRMVKNLNTQQDQDQLKERLKDLKNFKTPLKKTLEMAQNNQHWLKQHSKDFSRALRKYI